MAPEALEAREHYLALPKGSLLFEFRIDGVLGHGGFGITYLATDTHLQESVAIKEYFPNEMAVRDSSATVVPKSGNDEEDFDAGLKSFLEEARILARFRHPRIVHVRRFFEMHGTGYIVFEFVKGQTLSQRMASGDLPENQFRRIFDGVLEALDFLHEHAILHRDLKPNNIMLREDGAPVIIDFGAARDFSNRQSRDVTAIAAAGYSPPEQYGAGGESGPWTDLYALGGIAYRYVTGTTPPDSLRRLRNDPYVRATVVARGKFDEVLLQTIDQMLRIDETERPSSVDAVRRMLSGEVTSAKPAERRLNGFVFGPSGQVQLQFDRAIPAEQLELSLFVSPPGEYIAPSVNKTAAWLKTPHYFVFARSKVMPDGQTFEIPPELTRHIPDQSKVTITSRDGRFDETATWQAPPPRALSPALRWGVSALVLATILAGGGYYGYQWWRTYHDDAQQQQEIQRLSGLLDAAGSDRTALEQFVAQCTAKCPEPLKAQAVARLATLAPPPPPPRTGGANAAYLNAEVARWASASDNIPVRDVIQQAPELAAIVAVARRRLEADKYQDALLLLEEAGERGSAVALTALARMYDPNGFVPGKPFRNPDPRTAARYYKAAVQKGDVAATAPREALKQMLEREARTGNRIASATLKDFWP